MSRADVLSVRRGLLWVAFATAGLVLGGCALRAPRLRVQEGVPWPVLCRSVQERWGKLNTFESELRFSFDSELASLSGWGKVAYSRAGVFVVQLRGPLGVRAADVVATTDSLWVYVPFRNTLYVGSSDELRLTGEEQKQWVEALFGRPILRCEDPGTWRPRGENSLVVEQADDYGTRRYLVDRRGAAVREARFSWDGDRRVVIKYEGTSRLNGCVVARLVRVTSENPKARLAIAYENTRVNRRINWKRYRVKFPSTARRVPLKSMFLASRGVLVEPAKGD